MKKVSYTEISNRTGISISHISRVMRGKRIPSIRVLALLGWEMGLTLEQMLRKLKISKKTFKRLKTGYEGKTSVAIHHPTYSYK